MGYSVQRHSFEEASDHWERILPCCPTNTIFLTHHWQQLWWRKFGGNAELCLLTVQEEDSVRGIAPLMVKDGVISFLGDTDLFDYHDFLVPQGTEGTDVTISGEILKSNGFELAVKVRIVDAMGKVWRE